MDDIAAKLRDYGLTLQESVVICDRRVVDEAATLIEAFEEDSIANKSRLAHMRRQEDEIRDLKSERDALRSDNARLAKELEEARGMAEILRKQAERPIGIKPGKRITPAGLSALSKEPGDG